MLWLPVFSAYISKEIEIRMSRVHTHSYVCWSAVHTGSAPESMTQFEVTGSLKRGKLSIGHNMDERGGWYNWNRPDTETEARYVAHCLHGISIMVGLTKVESRKMVIRVSEEERRNRKCRGKDKRFQWDKDALDLFYCVNTVVNCNVHWKFLDY